MATRAEWIGRVGKEWSRRTDALEQLLGPPGQRGLDALGAVPGQRIVDLGCGSGSSTLALSRLVGPGGRVTAVDVSPDLVARARERLAGCGNVDLIEADAETHAFPPGHDALFSRFGAMFFDNPPAAFANLHRALAPGAKSVFVAWQKPAQNPWASLPMRFVTERMAAVPSSPGPGPFAWADRDVFRPLLEGAGFRDVSEATYEFEAIIGDGDEPDPVRRAILFMMRIGPLAARLREAPDMLKREAETFLSDCLAPHVKDGAVRLAAAAWIIEARA